MQCLYCGADIPMDGSACPSCGNRPPVYGAPDGFSFDRQRGRYCRQSSEGILWFDPFTGQYEKEPVSVPPEPDFETRQTGRPVPDGFSPDPDSGLFYRLDDSGIESGNRVWYMTWYDPATQEYAQVEYTAPEPDARRAAAPHAARKPAGKRPVIVIVCVAVVAALAVAGWVMWQNGMLDGIISSGDDRPASSADTAQIEGTGFSGAQDAAEAYLTALQSADAKGMMAAFAVESYVENYDIEAAAARFGLSDTSELEETMNLDRRADEISAGIAYQYLTLFETNGDALRPIEPDAAGPDELAAMLEDGGHEKALQTLNIVGFTVPESFSELYADERNQENLQKQAAVYGADGLQSVVARVEIDGREYWFFFDAVCYGDTWYLASFGGNIGALLGLNVTSGGVAGAAPVSASAASGIANPTPDATPSPTPDAAPSPTPTVTPSPTPEATPSPTPNPAQTPTPQPSAAVAPRPNTGEVKFHGMLNTAHSGNDILQSTQFQATLNGSGGYDCHVTIMNISDRAWESYLSCLMYGPVDAIDYTLSESARFGGGAANTYSFEVPPDMVAGGNCEIYIEYSN